MRRLRSSVFCGQEAPPLVKTDLFNFQDLLHAQDSKGMEKEMKKHKSADLKLISSTSEGQGLAASNTDVAGEGCKYHKMFDRS